MDEKRIIQTISGDVFEVSGNLLGIDNAGNRSRHLGTVDGNWLRLSENYLWETVLGIECIALPLDIINRGNISHVLMTYGKSSFIVSCVAIRRGGIISADRLWIRFPVKSLRLNRNS